MANIAQKENLADLGRLKSIGIVAWEQVMLLLPKGYNDYTKIEDRIVLPSVPGTKVCIAVKVASLPSADFNGTPRTSFFVTDGSTRARLNAFGDTFQWKYLKIGHQIVVECVVGEWNGYLQINNPVLVPSSLTGKVSPRYAGKKGVLSEQAVFDKTRIALSDYLSHTTEYILSHFPSTTEQELIHQAGLQFPSLAKMLHAIHAPDTLHEGMSGLDAAKRLATFHLVSIGRQRKAKNPRPDSTIILKRKDIEALVNSLPWPLAPEQTQSINEIVSDLERPYPMRRLLSGDVGCGKTVTFLIPLLAARATGARCAILVPNTLLVDQVTREINEYFANSGVNNPFVIVTGSKKTLPNLDGNPILIGTSALINRMAGNNWKPDFLVVDEQHKWSRQMREDLAAEHTNILEATATCIPRSAALVTHGGMDVSILKTAPVQKKITSRIVTVEEKGRLFEHLRKVMEAGGQIAIIYPRVEESDNAKKAVESAWALWERLFPGKVGRLHGKMSEIEKKDVIDRMKKGGYQAIISSTVIEAGLTIPSLRALAVVSAERYGVSTLHQMRGRVARLGGAGSFFLYLPDEISEDSRERLELLVQHDDGFTLAEKDMEIRGFGDLSGDSDEQSGTARSGLFYGVKVLPHDLVKFAERVAA